MRLQARLANGELHAVEVRSGGDHVAVSLDGRLFSVSVRRISQCRCMIEIDGTIFDAVVDRRGSDTMVMAGGKLWRFSLSDRQVGRSLQEDDLTEIRSVKAEMAGRVVKVLLGAGDMVERDGAVLVVEAMKMQNEVRSPRAGSIARIAVAEGELVSPGQLLFEVG